MAHFHGVCHGNCYLRYVRGALVLIKLDLGGLKGQFDVKKANFRGHSENRPLLDNFGYQNPPMAHFHGVCHRNCSLRYVGGALVLRKLDFRGLKGQYDVKKANFRGLIAKIGYMKPICLLEPGYGPF